MHRLRIFLLCTAGLVVVASALTTLPKSGDAGRVLLSGATVDRQVLSIIERSCRDCHSDETRYPWYSYVAPVSWWIRRDVVEGRTHLNFSRWSDYPPLIRQRKLAGIASQIRDREMPLPEYVLLHPDAKLSPADRTALFQWTQDERARLIAGSSGAELPR
jgi:Haem-binding domain